jgi:hypothetical protein
MKLMKRSDLIYSDEYSWTVIDNDNPKVTGDPDKTLFNRNEGYEVLYLINKIAEINGLKQISSGQKIEKMIHDHLPSNIRSQKNVTDWIEKNWKNY